MAKFCVTSAQYICVKYPTSGASRGKFHADVTQMYCADVTQNLAGKQAQVPFPFLRQE